METDSIWPFPTGAPPSSETRRSEKEVPRQSDSSSNGNAVPAAVHSVMRPPTSHKSAGAQGKAFAKEQS